MMRALTFFAKPGPASDSTACFMNAKRASDFGMVLSALIRKAITLCILLCSAAGESGRSVDSADPEKSRRLRASTPCNVMHNRKYKCSTVGRVIGAQSEIYFGDQHFCLVCGFLWLLGDST